MANHDLAGQIDAAIDQLAREGAAISANQIYQRIGGHRADVLSAVRARLGTSPGPAPDAGEPADCVELVSHGAAVPPEGHLLELSVHSAPPDAPPAPPAPSVLGGQLADAQQTFLVAQRENGTVHEQVRQLEAERTGLIARQKALLAHRRAAETVVELRRIKQELQALEEDVEVVDNHLRRLHPRASAAAQCYHATQQRLFQVQEVATRTLLEGRGAMQWGGDGAQRRLREELTALLGSAEMERLLPTTTRPDWARP